MPEVITKSKLICDLKNLGVQEGQTIMLHVSVKSIGWIVGGPEIVLRSILDAISPVGTLMMLVGWEDNPYHLKEWPEEKQKAYLNECPAFDPKISRADRTMGILTEYLRTFEGAERSSNPENSFAAVGKNSKYITKNQSLSYGYGKDSPLEKLYKLNGKVLLIGAPLTSTTILHYAENLAKCPKKRIVRFKMPIMESGKRVWKEIEEFDTSKGIIEWKGDYFEEINKDFLSEMNGSYRSGLVGNAKAYFISARDLVDFGIKWMEQHFK